MERWQSQVECVCLENKRGESLRGFESLLLRQFTTMPDTTNPEFKRLVIDLGFTDPPPPTVFYGNNRDYRPSMYTRHIANRPELTISCGSFTKDNIPSRVRVRNDNHKAEFTIVGCRRVMAYLRRVVDAIESLDYCVKSPA